MLRAFFMSLPQERFDSARVDGAGELHIMMIAIVSAVIICPLAQKHFKHGVVIGAVKG